MGVVYKARHRRLNRLVALKMIRGTHADEIQIARFKIEAEAVASASPPEYPPDLRHRRARRLPFVASSCSKGAAWSIA